MSQTPIYETIKAMIAMWSTSGPPQNNGIFLSLAPQKTMCPFAVLSLVRPGKVIPTMSSEYDDMLIQISCYSDNRTGSTLSQNLCDYAVGLYNRQFMSLPNNINNAGILRQGQTLNYWIEAEKLWQATCTFRVISGQGID